MLDGIGSAIQQGKRQKQKLRQKPKQLQ